MKRILVSLVGLCLISTAFAQRSRLTAPDLKSGPGMVRRVQPVPDNANPFLFYKLPAGFKDQSISDISFVVHEGGRIILVERIKLDLRDAAQRPAVPFLLKDALRLIEILGFARDPNRHLRMAILANGETLRDFTFDEFFAYNARLRKQPGLTTALVSSKVIASQSISELAGKPSGSDHQFLTCTQECDVAYQDCADANCGDPQSICGPCLSDWEACRDACPPPPPPPPATCTPSWSYQHRTEPTSTTGIHYECVFGSSGFTWHLVNYQNYVYYTILYTVYSDCSTSDEVVSADCYSLSIYDEDTGDPC